jgi:chromosome segregation ATPase
MSDPTTTDMSNYPNFDAQWRERDAAAQAAQAELESLFRRITGEKGVRIRAAVEKLSATRKSCQELLGSVNSQYKSAKVELEKTKEENEKVVKKAKQQKKIITGLQSRIGKGPSPVTQDQKRSADEAEFDSSAKPQPQKRSRDETLGDDAVYHERRDSPRVPRSVDREAIPQALTTDKQSIRNGSSLDLARQ